MSVCKNVHNVYVHVHAYAHVDICLEHVHTRTPSCACLCACDDSGLEAKLLNFALPPAPIDEAEMAGTLPEVAAAFTGLRHKILCPGLPGREDEEVQGQHEAERRAPSSGAVSGAVQVCGGGFCGKKAPPPYPPVAATSEQLAQCVWAGGRFASCWLLHLSDG